MKKILQISIWTIIIIGITVMLFKIEQLQGNKICNGLSIFIDVESNNEFIKSNEIKQILNVEGYTIEGMLFSEINIEDIFRVIKKNQYVKSANIYKTINGKLIIEITQKRPILRVINNKGNSYYIDEDGGCLPLSKNYTARVPIALGFINENYLTNELLNNFENTDKKTWVERLNLYELFVLAKYIDKSAFWNAQIDQIIYDENKEVMLISKVGNQKILMGSIDDMERKFSKLFVFYLKVMNNIGWNKYQIINLKYDNQVVCTK